MSQIEPNKSLPWILLLLAIVVLVAVYLLRDRGSDQAPVESPDPAEQLDDAAVERMLDGDEPAPPARPGSDVAPPEATPASEPIAE